MGNEHDLQFGSYCYDNLASHWQGALELHELLHFRYPNHGKMFNILLDAYVSRKGDKVNES